MIILDNLPTEIPQDSSRECQGQRYVDGGLPRCNDNEANVGARYALDSKNKKALITYERRANVLRRTAHGLGASSLIVFLGYAQMYQDQQTVDATLRYKNATIA